MSQNPGLLAARFERNLAAYGDSLATVRRLRRQVAEGKELVRQQGRRRMTRLRWLLVAARMDEGRLPDIMPAVVSGEPGFGGQCDACDGYIRTTQVMMVIPDGDWFAYVHADCYLIWAALCRRRAALRHIA